MNQSSTIHQCRLCSGERLSPILDLGRTPLANRLPRREELQAEEPTFPLVLVFCESCSLVQITTTVAPEVLFFDYVYRSSFSDAFVEHSRRHVADLIRQRGLGPRSRVIEAASNDGYLLQHFVAAGVPVLGIEPAENIAQAANARGVTTRAEFFSRDYAISLRREGITADVVLGNNVLAHVPDPNGFVAGAAALLVDSGIVEFEFPYLGDLIDNIEFDTIYHEHMSYFSAHAIERLFARNDLIFTDVLRLPVHGGSLRVTGARRADPAGRARVEALLADELRRGMTSLAFYRDFSSRVLALKTELRSTLEQLRAEGKRIAAYGASAKGSTLLNFFGIGRRLIEYVVDRSTEKQGRFTPGTHLEIFAPERLLADRPDYALLLTWNFAEEILRQQAPYRAQGGKFIVPLPQVQVL